MVRLGLVSPVFIGHSFIEETNSFGILLSPEIAAALALGKGLEMTAVYNGLLVSWVSCTIPSLTENEYTISLKATARLETA